MHSKDCTGMSDITNIGASVFSEQDGPEFETLVWILSTSKKY